MADVLIKITVINTVRRFKLNTTMKLEDLKVTNGFLTDIGECMLSVQRRDEK